MDLKVIYRYYASENMKGRPSYYSKDLSLGSLLRATHQAPGADVIFLVDGEVEPRVRAVMEQYGAIEFISAGTAPRAFNDAIQIPRRKQWDDDALVLLVEDDYLFRPDALAGMLDAADRFPDVDYFAPYCQAVDYPSDPHGLGGEWSEITSTTLTYAGRAGAFKKDERFQRLCVKSGADSDTALFFGLNGHRYFGWGQLLRDTFEKAPAKAMVRRVARSGVRVAVNLSIRRRPSRIRSGKPCRRWEARKASKPKGDTTRSR